MRKDFLKVLTERPRRGSRHMCYHEVRRRDPIDIEGEELGVYEGMRAAHIERKDFSDLIGPLRRFLQASIGRPWNEVNSEVCAHLKGRNTIQQHLLDHLYGYVEVNLHYGEDGNLYDNRGWIFGERRAGNFYTYTRDFYVDPASGILCVTKKRPYEPRPQPNYTGYIMDDGVHIRLDNNIWYEITIETRDLSYWTRDIHDQPYYREHVIQTEKRRQLNSKELRRYGVKNQDAA